jgi:hypothetical protein
MSAALFGERKHLVPPQLRQPSVSRIRLHAEVDRAVALISTILSEQRAHLFDHLRDELGGARRVRRWRHVQRRHEALELPGFPLGELPEVDISFCGHSEDIVVHIGDVLDVDDIRSQVPEITGEDVEMDVRERMAQMRRVVRRDAADVHGHSRANLDLAELPGGLVVKTHGPSIARGRASNASGGLASASRGEEVSVREREDHGRWTRRRCSQTRPAGTWH